MSIEIIEAEKKRLTAFLAEQTLVHEGTEQRPPAGFVVLRPDVPVIMITAMPATCELAVSLWSSPNRD
jgi:hypothetical protein